MRSRFYAIPILFSFALFLAWSPALAGVSIIREDGSGDFTSVAAWESATQSDLIAANDSAIARIEGSWASPDVGVTISGFTTDTDHYVRIYTAPDARHNGKWDNTKYRMEMSYSGHGTVISVRDSYIRIEGLQVKIISTGNGSCTGIAVGDGTATDTRYRTRISHCIFQGDGTAASSGSVNGYSQGNNYMNGPVIFNNIFYNLIVPASGDGLGLALNRGSQGTSYKDFVYNNTIYGCGTGIWANWSGNVRLKNNILNGNGIDYSFGGSSAPVSANNITEDATSPDGASFQNQTVTFVDAANGDFHLADTDNLAKDMGVDLSADPEWAIFDDIEGETRTGTWDIGADEVAGVPAEKDPNIYYSVGTNTAPLYSGTASATSKGVMVLGSAAANNIGVGDEVQVGSYRYYIRLRESTTQFRIQNSKANGGVPGDTNVTFTSQSIGIYRAYNSLDAPIKSDASDVNHLGTLDLVSGGYVLHIACYGDGGADNMWATVEGWVTSATNYVRIFTPVSSSEVGVTQRHSGVWDDTKYTHKPTQGHSIGIHCSNIRIEGLQIQTKTGSGDNTTGILVQEPTIRPSNIRISSCIIRKGYATAVGCTGIKIGTGSTAPQYAWNNIVYGFDGTGGTGIICVPSYGSAVSVVANNTIANCDNGINGIATTSAVNNLLYNCTDPLASATPDYNATDHATETMGANGLNGQTFSFVAAGSNNFHLAGGDVGAQDHGSNLAADPNLAFSDDVDGATRSAPWDIGADENTVVDIAPPTMGAISAPVGGAAWTTGDAATISWSATDDIGLSNFVVKLSTNNGAAWTQLADTSVGSVTSWSGSLAYTASANVASATCLVRVIAYDGTNVDSATTAAFSIADNDAPTVAVTSPNGAEGWPATGVKDIKWTDSDNIAVASCSLYYSLDNSSWTFIAVVAGGVGTYSWTLPDQQSVCWVRVRATDAVGLQTTDDSDAEFSITTKPYFTCDDSIRVDQGGALNFNMEYDQGGIPGAAIVTAISKPSWVFQVGSVLLGTAPSADQVDTAKVELNVGGYRDTLVLRIYVGSGGVGVDFTPVAVVPIAFGLSWRSTSNGVVFRVATVESGDFTITVFNAKGQRVWQETKRATGPGHHRVAWRPETDGTVTVLLSQGARRQAGKMVIVQ